VQPVAAQAAVEDVIGVRRIGKLAAAGDRVVRGEIDRLLQLAGDVDVRLLDDRERLDGVASDYVCEKFQACYFLRVSARPFLSIQSLAKRWPCDSAPL
jgi:hypothetical protein